MSVLKGEGKVPILFGSTSINAGTRTHGAYLSRPDLSGEWPTVVLITSAWGLTSSMKALCRKLARQGLAVVSPDVYRRQTPPRDASRGEAEVAWEALSTDMVDRDLADIVGFITNVAGYWSSAEDGFAVLGIGSGAEVAARLAVRNQVPALAVVAGDPEALAEDATGYAGALLALYGKDDEVVDVDAVAALRDADPHAEVVMYGSVGHDFMDDYRDDFDHDASEDAVERLTAFFEKHLPAAP